MRGPMPVRLVAEANSGMSSSGAAWSGMGSVQAPAAHGACRRTRHCALLIARSCGLYDGHEPAKVAAAT